MQYYENSFFFFCEYFFHNNTSLISLLLLHCARFCQTSLQLLQQEEGSSLPFLYIYPWGQWYKSTGQDLALEFLPIHIRNSFLYASFQSWFLPERKTPLQHKHLPCVGRWRFLLHLPLASGLTSFISKHTNFPFSCPAAFPVLLELLSLISNSCFVSKLSACGFSNS